MDPRRSLLPAAVLAAVLLTGCSGAEDDEAAAATASRTSSAPAASASTTPPAEETGATPDAGASTTEAPPDGGAGPATGPRPGWPAEVVPTHGDRVWAVYLAVGAPDSQWDMHKLGETESYLRGIYGYTGSGIGSVGCDQGAAEALGFDPGHNRVAVYFDSAARAQEFVAIYDRQDVGSAEVTTYCLD